MEKVTMQQIAEELNISKSAVSLALANSYTISEELRSKVVMTAIRMGYDMNRVVQKRSKSEYTKLGIFVHSINVLQDGFWSEVIKGIERKLCQSHTLLHFIETRFSNEEIIRNVTKIAPQGLLVLDRLPDGLLEKLYAVKIPMVFIDYEKCLDNNYDEINLNNYGTMWQVAKYVTEMGHDNLLFVGDIHYSLSFLERYRGLQDYCERYHVRCRYILDDELSSYMVNLNQLERVLLSDDPPSVIICANDPIALKVYTLCQKLQLRVPEDISLVGFDNNDRCIEKLPILTSVHVPKVEIGEAAVEMLQSRQKNPNRSKQILMLAARIVPRKSVKNLK